MNYIIMDLEWNNVFAKRYKRSINEVIEVGAVKLDENLNYLDSFSCVVRSQIGKKLRSNVKNLTHITNEEIRKGELFGSVFSRFNKWVEKDSAILTWGDSDVRVLIDNYKYFHNMETIPFLHKYGDLQAFVDEVLNVPMSKQIGLSTAAEQLDISDEGYSLHRALDDSRLSAECLRKTFDREKLNKYIKKCDGDFYARIAFKPYNINNIHNPLVDKSELEYKCEVCNGECRQIGKWISSNNAFKSSFYCPNCDRTVKVSVKFKKLYDRVDIKKLVRLIEPVEVGPDADSNVSLISNLPVNHEDDV